MTRLPAALRRRPTPTAQHIATADRARDLRDWTAAATAYRAALDLSPALAPIWVQYGHALKESGDFAAAETAYRRALTLQPQGDDTHLQLGHLLKLLGRLDAAADAYLTAIELHPGQTDALRELQDLGAHGARVPADRLAAVIEQGLDSASQPPPTLQQAAAHSGDALDALLALLDRAEPAERAAIEGVADLLRKLAVKPGASAGADGAALVFDASDLLHHFRHTRLPTGIQRVQLEIIASLIADPAESVAVCCLFHARWVDIPARLFALLARLSLLDSDMTAPDWRHATLQLELVLGAAAPFAFPHGACLINLGTSWFPDYLLHIRAAKHSAGVRYVPFVHDLIPIKAPEFCMPDVVENYVGWLLGVFQHADLFLTNSHSTATDLRAAAETLGVTLAPDHIVVVPLDAAFGKPASSAVAGDPMLRRWGLLGQDFVLFVSTIEPRKNHVTAIEAWRTLLKDGDPRQIPKLVCVGGRGWMNEEVFRQVERDDRLRGHVHFLHDVSDADLSALYDACLFTLYPSHYEGWGLPVTESLCHGKVALVSNVAALPEAGGRFADYFTIGSHPELVAALRRLIADPAYRQSREAMIAAEFHPRSWRALALQIATAVESRLASVLPAPRPPVARLGCYYPIARNQARRLRAELASGEPYRAGTSWYGIEDWGCWTRAEPSELAWRHAEPEGAMRAYIGPCGLPSRACNVTITVGTARIDAPLAPGQMRWLPIVYHPDADGAVTVGVSSDVSEDLTSTTGGNDTRVIGPGLRGIFLCRADDLATRADFLEALTLDLLDLGFVSPHATHRAAGRGAAPLRDPAPVVGTPASALPPPPEPILIEQGPALADADIVVLQTSDAEAYRAMLDQSARTTRRYCARHGLRYEAFIGLKRGSRPWHATYNRIDLLRDLIDRGFRGWVLYVDADAWIADLDFDLRGLLRFSDRFAMIAAPSNDRVDHFWNVNIGVMLFNLGHPFMRWFIEEWEHFLSRYDLAAEAIEWDQEVPDDQGMFHQILDKHADRRDVIYHIDKGVLNSPWASFVRQAIRAENTSFDDRLALITQEVDAIVAAADLPASISADAD